MGRNREQFLVVVALVRSRRRRRSRNSSKSSSSGGGGVSGGSNISQNVIANDNRTNENCFFFYPEKDMGTIR